MMLKGMISVVLIALMSTVSQGDNRYVLSIGTDGGNKLSVVVTSDLPKNRLLEKVLSDIRDSRTYYYRISDNDRAIGIFRARIESVEIIVWPKNNQ